MRRLFEIVSGAAVGLWVAAALPIWPLLYADIVRHAPLWRAYDFPLFDNEAWVMPLCVTAALIGSGEIGIRRFDRWLVRRANVRRTMQGRCAGCGYNLTGNTSGVCPECGTPISPKAGATEAARPPSRRVR